MTSDDKWTIIGCTFWAIVIIAMILGAFKTVQFVWSKSTNAISSYQEAAATRKVEAGAKKVTLDTKKETKKVALDTKKEVAKKTVVKRTEPKRKVEKVGEHNFDDYYTDGQCQVMCVALLLGMFCFIDILLSRTGIIAIITAILCAILAVIIYNF